jgi:predicted metal-dependent HD superfamily phosphohydrolase
MDYKRITDQTQSYVRNFFDVHVNEKLFYHDRRHTEMVVSAAIQIAKHYSLGDADACIVTVSAWFHDIGYLTGAPSGHEERGAKMAQTYLETLGVGHELIDPVRGCILATQLPQRAVTLNEQIVCDADLFHLGTDDFNERNKLIRKETEALQGRKISKDEWRRGTIRMLEVHCYFTDYCRKLLAKKQEEHLEDLRSKEPDAGSGTISGTRTNTVDSLVQEHLKEDGPATDKKDKKKDPGRGIDTVFRITSNNNQKLSSQADSKAHILIQVNSIIISVLLSLLLRRIEDHISLAVPTILLLTVNVVTIIFSILATRPHIPPGRWTKADLDQKKVNLLFFGNFYRMSLEDYASGMLVMLDDRDFLYGSLIRDVYFQGIALGKKYRWLRLSYNVFMYGLIVSVLAFLIAALWFGRK